MSEGPHQVRIEWLFDLFFSHGALRITILLSGTACLLGLVLSLGLSLLVSLCLLECQLGYRGLLFWHVVIPVVLIHRALRLSHLW